MKNTIKLLGIMITVIGFSMAGCWWQETYPVGDTISSTVTASPSGEIIFGYTADPASLTCTITTNLPEPNKAFSVSSGGEKTISELEANQIVSWSATVEMGYLFRLVDYDEVNEIHLYSSMHE
jgi:hypothetical protein